jgi:hypothetical protein
MIATTLSNLSLHAKTGKAPEFAPVPAEVSSSHFTVTIDGRQTPVLHAAGGYYLLNFDVLGPTEITVTADDEHYWDRGVEIQPMRFGIRPERHGASIRFPLSGPAKLSITRPGDHFGDSEMLFLFANQPDLSDISASTPGIRYYAAGVHREDIDAHSGDKIYIAAGAVIFGSLNLWQVHDVHVWGQGTIVYDGPQDPNHDEGWMHKPNWHIIVMDKAENITIEGITGIARSRTWMIQMKDSHRITFRNIKIIGNSTGNANQDGMDWLGGGDTLVQDSFFRAADDVFAMYGNWDGYTDEALTTPGHEVNNIIIENSVLSTSISNIVRVGWPRKVFDSHRFTLRNSDVLHAGMGACGVPFALFEIWANPAGKGLHSDYRFDDIRLEDWYSLVQLRQHNPGVEDVHFNRIWAMDGAGMVPSVIDGDITGVSFQDVELGMGQIKESRELPLQLKGGAKLPSFENSALSANFTYSAGILKPGNDVTFKADSGADYHYKWMFGDGTIASGAIVHHVFSDGEGSFLDGTGRYHVLLLSTDRKGREAWASRTLVVSKSVPLPSIETDGSSTKRLSNAKQTDYGFKGYLHIPADGGYTITLLSSTKASLVIDGIREDASKLRPQVCGSAGSAVQRIRLSSVFSQGTHRIEVSLGSEPENVESGAQLLWEGPAIRLERIPLSALELATP